MWTLFATAAAYAMNTFALEALSGFSPFQLVFLRDSPDLTSLSFPKIDTIPVNYREYYNLLLARAQMIGRLLLEWRTQQALEYKKKNKQYTNEEIFQDDQMVYLLAPHSLALQTDTTKFKQDFIGPLFIDTALDKTHYRLKDATGLLLDGMYHVNWIKKGSACTPQGIVNTFDGYEKALKNTLLNKFAIETPNNKMQEVTLKDGSKELNYLPGSITYRTPRDGEIDIMRWKRDTGIQYRHEKKEDVTGFIPKPIAQPEYGMVYQHQGMLLQNLHHRYLYIVI